MNIERLGIRFNLDKEKDRMAFEFLQGYDKERYKSLNKFLIEIISEYAENYNIEKERPRRGNPFNSFLLASRFYIHIGIYITLYCSIFIFKCFDVFSD